MPKGNRKKKLLRFIKPEVGTDNYERWFSNIKLDLNLEENEIVFRVPNAIHQFWIESNYSTILERGILETYQQRLKPIFVIKGAEKNKIDGKKSKKKGNKKNLIETDHQLASRNIPVAAKAMSPTSNTVEDRNRAVFPLTSDKKSNQARKNIAGLNPHYSLGNFIVGGNCQFAAAAAQAVSEKPGRVYNPLFIYGGTGLGKTHLMQAIGQAFARNQIREGKKAPKVIYITSEDFTNDFVTAISKGAMSKFRQKYRKADLLLIDDIQFLANKDSTQEEFFHTFNAVFDSQKQIVLTSDRPPSEVSELEQRLVSRFEWGLTAELLPPSYETRTAILQRKVEDLQLFVPQEVIEYLATRIRSNVRRLEGALIRVASYAALGTDQLDQSRIDELLKDFLNREVPQCVKIERIQQVVADHFGLDFDDMSSKARPRRIAYPRQIAMYLARKLSGASLKEIGNSFGGRDHGTVLYAHRLIGDQLTDDADLKLHVGELEGRLEKAEEIH